MIAGGLKTKFKYVEVEKADYGLNDDDLLYCDDELLNQFISIKKLFPYRQEDVILFDKYIRLNYNQLDNEDY